jgi:hypothetical protein
LNTEEPLTRAVPEGSVIDLSDAQVPNIVLPIPPPPATVPHAPKNVTDRNDEQPENVLILPTDPTAPKSGKVTDLSEEQVAKAEPQVVHEVAEVGMTTVSKFVQPEKAEEKSVNEF